MVSVTLLLTWHRKKGEKWATDEGSRTMYFVQKSLRSVHRFFAHASFMTLLSGSMWSMNTDLCCPALRGALEYILRSVRKLMSAGDIEATHAHVIE